MTEAALLRIIGRLCRRYDVVLDHRYQPQHDRPGWPDCSLLGRSAAAFRELKTSRGKLSPAQQQTGDRMIRAGLDWGVWRPGDLECGRIEAELAALSSMRPWTEL